MHARRCRQALRRAQQGGWVAGSNLQRRFVLCGALGEAAQGHVDRAALREEGGGSDVMEWADPFATFLLSGLHCWGRADDTENQTNLQP